MSSFPCSADWEWGDILCSKSLAFNISCSQNQCTERLFPPVGGEQVGSNKQRAACPACPTPPHPTPLPTLASKHPFHWVWHHSVFKGRWTQIAPIFTLRLHVPTTAVMGTQEIMTPPCSPCRTWVCLSERFPFKSFLFVILTLPWKLFLLY